MRKWIGVAVAAVMLVAVPATVGVAAPATTLPAPAPLATLVDKVEIPHQSFTLPNGLLSNNE